MFSVHMLSLAVWLSLAAYLTRPAIRAFSDHGKRLDMLWAALWPLCANRCAFIITGEFLKDSPIPLFACYILSIVAGLFFFSAIRFYRKLDA